MIKTLSSLRPNATFLHLHNYQNNYGEISDFDIIFHISYQSALEKSIKTASSYIPTNDIEASAKEAVVAAYKSSLNKILTTAEEDIDDAYIRFGVKGVLLHKNTHNLHIFGLLHNKRVVVPGVYKAVKSSPLTIAKNNIRKLCAANKYRQFIIEPNRVERITVEKIDLIP